MPTKSTNIGGQGGARQGSGRKKAAVVDKITDESKRVKILDIPDVEGSEMPKPNEILSAKQKNGEAFQAKSIYENTWEWLQKIGCTVIVSPQLIERYAMCSARWIQCEEMTNELGFLSKHPTLRAFSSHMLILIIVIDFHLFSQCNQFGRTFFVVGVIDLHHNRVVTITKHILRINSVTWQLWIH